VEAGGKRGEGKGGISPVEKKQIYRSRNEEYKEGGMWKTGKGQFLVSCPKGRDTYTHTNHINH